MNAAPTLMIGLGGVGSRIVDRLYGMLPEKHRQNVVIHALDTNHNDLGRLKYLNRDSMDQISAPHTVGDYLKSLERAGLKTTVEQWVPENIPPHTTMAEGAGQTRAVARIAYHATLLREGKLPNFEKQLPGLFEIGRSQAITNTRVIIVSTLAGGTGAGTFLQTALYVRKILKDQRPDATIKVRGAFILPSMAERFNEIEVERERMSANGYACLKELNAMLLAKGRPEIQLEYRPDQAMDAEGRVDLSVPISPPIFDSVFAYEASTRQGDFLPSWEQYEDQVTETLYLQFFSPVGQKNFSQEDNIFTFHGGKVSNRILASAGSASIQFPRKDLLDYFGLHWARTLMTEDWRAMDNAYKDQRKIWQEDGAIGSGPVRSDIYLRQLQHEAEPGRSKYFFERQWGTLHGKKNEMGELGPEKVIQFLEKVDARIHGVLEGSAAYTEARKRFSLPNDLHLSAESQIEEQVASGEASLQFLRHTVQKTIGELVHPLVNDTVLSAVRKDRGQTDYSLMTFLQDSEGPLHPVAIRYFLYRTEKILERRMRDDAGYESAASNVYRQRRTRIGRPEGLENEANRLEQSIRRYDEQYDVPGTGITEQAIDHVSTALEQGMLGRLFRGCELKAFALEYVNKSRAQFQELQSYAHFRLRLMVYKELLNCVKQMSRAWESCFDALPDCLDVLHEREARLGRFHDENINPTRIHVLASKRCKDFLWQDQNVSLEYEGAGLFSDAVQELYSRACEDYQFTRTGRKLRLESRRTETAAEKLVEMVNSWCRDTLEEKKFINFNAVQAMRREAEINGVDPEQHIIDRFTALDNRARPWLVHDQIKLKDLRNYMLWGVHPVNVEVLGADLAKRAFAVAQDGGAEATKDKGFSPYCIYRYRSIGGLAAEDLHDFSDGGGSNRSPGRSFLRYQRWIRAVAGPHAPRITPHLDKRWHLPAYLPDINPDQVEQDRKRLCQAFIFGLVYGHVQVVNHERSKVWLYSSGNTAELIRMNDVPVAAELHRLYRALLCNPQYVDQILAQARIHHEMDIPRAGRIRDTTYYIRVGNIEAFDGRSILDLILSMRRTGGGRQHVHDAIEELLRVLLTSLGDFYCDFHGVVDRGVEHLTVRPADSLRRLVNNMVKESEAYKELQEGDMKKVQIDQILESFISRIGSKAIG